MDVGAGSGAKVGVFAGDSRMLAEGFLPVERYGETPERFADELAERVRDLWQRGAEATLKPDAVGVACPGLLTTDGTLSSVNNLPWLEGANLGDLLRERLGLPVACANDADAGGLAEWNRHHREILYWVLGGGWGGAWLSADGAVRFPSVDWNGDDGVLHVTNEPGYAIPLANRAVADILQRAGTTRARFERVYRREKGAGAVLSGPNGRTDCVRAEMLVSGSGRWRIFQSLLPPGGLGGSALSEEERLALCRPAAAGKVIDRLSAAGVSVAVLTDRVFAEALALAAVVLLGRAEADGLPRATPIYIGGKPSAALPFFGPAAEERLRAEGFGNPLRLSRLQAEGRNANLHGAAVLARRALDTGRR